MTLTVQQQEANQNWLMMSHDMVVDGGLIRTDAATITVHKTCKYRFSVPNEELEDMWYLYGTDFCNTHFKHPDPEYARKRLAELETLHKIQTIQNAMGLIFKELESNKKTDKNRRRAERRKHARKLAKADECGYCLDPVCDDKRTLPCGHSFHRSCFNNDKKYREKNNIPLTCPMCRTDL